MYEPHHVLTWIVIGFVAGLLAGRVAHGRGFGCLGDIAIGLAGAVVGGAIVDQLVPDHRFGFAGSIAVAFLGALLLAYLLRALVRREAPQRLRRGRWG